MPSDYSCFQIRETAGRPMIDCSPRDRVRQFTPLPTQTHQLPSNVSLLPPCPNNGKNSFRAGLSGKSLDNTESLTFCLWSNCYFLNKYSSQMTIIRFILLYWKGLSQILPQNDLKCIKIIIQMVEVVHLCRFSCCVGSKHVIWCFGNTTSDIVRPGTEQSEVKPGLNKGFRNKVDP